MEVIQQTAQAMFTLDHPTHAAEARRFAVRYAEEAGMGENEAGAIAIAVTEMAGNVVKHAKAGKIVFEPITRQGISGLRVLALDKGPGISNIASALEDGYSTAGTNGSGLGAVRRLAALFDVISMSGQGTCVLAEFWRAQKPAPSACPLQISAISLPMLQEKVCGDGWATLQKGGCTWLMVVDGLGHGTHAADAAREAERVFQDSAINSPAEVLKDIHDALKKTRGAAAAIAAINSETKTLRYAGLGNISATLAGPQGGRGLASHNGTLGHQMHRIQEFSFPWHDDSVLIMHSDGLSSRWDLSGWHGIWSRHPGLIAGLLYRDFAKERDDVTVLVAKNC